MLAICGEGSAVCAVCSTPAHELTQFPGCGAPMETIVAAALRLPTPPAFHEDTWMGKRVYPDHLTISAPSPARHGTLLHPLSAMGIRVGPQDQGFLTNTGRFVGREDAYDIAVASGQPMIDHPSRIVGTLYSEDLW